MSYYERWIHSISQTLIQRGVISIDELGRKMAEAQAQRRWRPLKEYRRKFRSGDRVAVRAAYPIGHVRTPYYIRGNTA